MYCPQFDWIGVAFVYCSMYTKIMQELNRVLDKREAKKTPEVLPMYNYSCAIEVKQTKTLTLPANSLKPHQYKALMKVKYGVLRHKIPDMGRENPFDAFILAGLPAYVVIIFGDNTIIEIDIDAFPPIDQKLTKENALRIGRVL